MFSFLFSIKVYDFNNGTFYAFGLFCMKTSKSTKPLVISMTYLWRRRRKKMVMKQSRLFDKIRLAWLCEQVGGADAGNPLASVKH